MHCIGVDVGFGYTKATDGIRTIIFPPVISPAEKIGFRPFREERTDRQIDLLGHLSVTLGGETHFIGNLALNQGRFVYATLDRVRTQTPEFKLLFLTALSLSAESSEEPFSVVTGLPVDDFENRDILEKGFKGKFSISLSGQEVSFIVKDLTVIPQGCGAFMDLLFPGTQGDFNEAYAQGPVGIVDIGYKATDFVLMQSAEFAWRFSGSIKHGMSLIYQATISKFSDAYRGNFDLKSVEEAIPEGIIYWLGERIAIDPSLLDADFNGLAREIASWIRQQWREQKLSRILCGHMQVNFRIWGKRLGVTKVQLLDPRINVWIAAIILRHHLSQYPFWEAVGRYHFADKERQVGYAWRVYQTLLSNRGLPLSP